MYGPPSTTLVVCQFLKQREKGVSIATRQLDKQRHRFAVKESHTLGEIRMRPYRICLSLLGLLHLLPSSVSTATNVELLHQFSGPDGSQPFGDVILIGDTLFGANFGTVYRVDTDGSNFEVLHEFTLVGEGGSESFGGLVFDGTSLYGTTRFGGAGGNGTVFAVDPNGGNFRTLHDFNGLDGDRSESGLALIGDTLYGLTAYGGENDRGTVFSIDTDGSDFQVLHSFDTEDGIVPLGTPIVQQGRLYATTYAGGTGVTRASGTVFAIDTDGSDFEVLHTFSFLDGANSGAGLELVGNRLYGTTLEGGNVFENRAFRGGVVFGIDTDGTGFEVLHNFQLGVDPNLPPDGTTPGGTVTFFQDRLVGTAVEGGEYGFGTIFSIGLDGNGYRTLHDFEGAPNDGAEPLPLAGFAVDGDFLYGTTMSGGASNAGTVFSFKIPEPSGIALMLGLLTQVSLQRGRRLGQASPSAAWGSSTSIASGSRL